jgi:hypothetical protein
MHCQAQGQPALERIKSRWGWGRSFRSLTTSYCKEEVVRCDDRLASPSVTSPARARRKRKKFRNGGLNSIRFDHKGLRFGASFDFHAAHRPRRQTTKKNDTTRRYHTNTTANNQQPTMGIRQDQRQDRAKKKKKKKKRQKVWGNRYCCTTILFCVVIVKFSAAAA